MQVVLKTLVLGVGYSFVESGTSLREGQSIGAEKFLDQLLQFLGVFA